MRLALFQGPEVSADVTSNLAALDGAAARASGAGADLLVCPEMSVSGYNIGSLARERAEPADGPVYAHVAGTARRHRLAIAYGYPELADGGVYNAAQLVDSDGRVLANYRKSHLYGDLDRDLFLPGGEGVGPVRPRRVCGSACLTCYDVEFPEAVRAHALAGTELLVVPTALMPPFEFVTPTLVPARAFESQVYVAYVNRTGIEGDLEYVGLSASPAPTASTRARRRGARSCCSPTSTRLPWSIARRRNTYLPTAARSCIQAWRPHRSGAARDLRSPRRAARRAHRPTRRSRCSGRTSRSRTTTSSPTRRASARFRHQRTAPRSRSIGGGLSGIVAAYELMKLGLKPVVYEADRDRRPAAHRRLRRPPRA